MDTVDYRLYNLSAARRVEGTDGNLLAELLDSKSGDKILIAPRSGADIRDIATLAANLANAWPDKKIAYDFNAVLHPVSAGDTATEIIIRKGGLPPGRYLDINAKGQDALGAEIITSREANIALFDVVIDAIRLSRENGGKAIEFKFNQHALSVSGTDDAEEIERMVPKADRVTNKPRPLPPSKPLPRDPDEKVGGFTIRGNVKPSY